MESVFVKNSPTLGELSVTIGPEDYLPVFEKELKKIATKAHIKGFRPGKTPVSVVRNMYGKAILAEEITNLLNKTVDTYIKENNVEYLGELLPIFDEDIDFDFLSKKSYDFKFQVATPSPFELNLSAVSLNLYQPIMNEEDIDAVIQKNAEIFGREEEIETVEDACNIMGKITWQAENEEDADSSLQEPSCYLPVSSIKAEKQNIAIGKKVGETFELIPSQDLDLGEDNKKFRYIFGIFDEKQVENLKDKTVKVLIETITQKKSRELDKEFFDELFPDENIETIEQFREKIIALENTGLEREFAFFNNRLLRDTIIEATHFDLPDEFLKNWLLKQNQQLSAEQIEKEYAAASKEIRWSVIQRRVVKEENISVSKEEISNYTSNFILNQLRQYGLLNNPEFAKSMPNLVKNYLSADGGKNFTQIYETILSAKCQESIKEKVQVEYVKIHWKELDAMVAEYFKKDEPLEDASEASAT